VDEPTDTPVPLAGKTKRLKSLSEFDPPYWKGLFKLSEQNQRVPVVALFVGLTIGIVLGYYLFV
jgi:hypothetical protein